MCVQDIPSVPGLILVKNMLSTGLMPPSLLHCPFSFHSSFLPRSSSFALPDPAVLWQSNARRSWHGVHTMVLPTMPNAGVPVMRYHTIPYRRNPLRAAMPCVRSCSSLLPSHRLLLSHPIPIPSGRQQPCEWDNPCRGAFPGITDVCPRVPHRHQWP